ncbi:MAG: hypothetical protein M1828_006444 [Chrysothrix sp. TS-e1954]|nr:MAG: hypothetical protein M1828_006444 [Chrysothrix sp. TS-e1954]
MTKEVQLPDVVPAAVAIATSEGQAAATTSTVGSLDVEEPSDNVAESEVEYPSNFRLTIISIALALATAVVALDISILATAVPSITNHFKTISDIGWYYSGYTLTTCSFQFMFGKLYSVFSVKTVFLTTFVIFLVGSAVSGAAPSSTALVAGRAISGLGCAGIISGAFVISVGFDDILPDRSRLTEVQMQSVPLRRRPLWAGAAGMIEGTFAVVGPLLGGAITNSIGWRWCFYINLPIGFVTMLVIAIWFQNPRINPNAGLPLRDKLRRLDLLGTAVFVPSIVALLLALQWGGSKYGWGNARIIVLLVLFVILLAVFVYIQYRKQDLATLPPRIITQRSVIAGMLFAVCNNASLGVINYYVRVLITYPPYALTYLSYQMPIYFQSVKQRNPAQSGIWTLPAVVGLIISITICGPGITCCGYYAPFMVLSSIISPIAAGLLTTLKTNTSIGKLIVYQGMAGFGAGLGFQGPQLAAQTVLSQADAPIGIAAVMFAQLVGPAIFVSVAQTIFTGRLIQDLALYAPDVDANALETMGLTGLIKHLGATNNLAGALESYDMAVTQTFILPVVLACLSIAGSMSMEWKSVKHKRL